MKILKIFGIVVGIHVFALILIFANPGCSSTTKPTPQPADTAVTPAPAATPSSGVYSSAADSATIVAAPGGFNPDAPALAATSSSIRFNPTRPGTPAAGSLVSEPVADVTPATTYTVKSGDSLSAIAKKHHLTVAQLTGANGLAANAVLRPGQKMIIPGKPASAPAAATAVGAAGTAKPATKSGDTPATGSARAADGVKHTVKSGETLGAIARIYGVRPGDIAEANNISDPAKIKAGTELTIPGWTPAAKSGKSGKNAQKSSGTAATKSAPASAPPVAEPAPEVTQPTPPPPVPVIHLDDSPAISPAPKP